MQNPQSTDHKITKYFFICVCIIEIAFILWRFVISPTKNSGTFLVTFIIVLLLSLPLGLSLVLNIFKNKQGSFFFTFGLCFGYGSIASIWALMIRVGCPLNPYIYVGAVFIIATCFLCRKWKEFKKLFDLESLKYSLTELLSPIAVLLFAFILLSITWFNSYVPTDVDCQSDGYNALMIFKEGKYPIVSPFLDQTRLRLNVGLPFHILVATIAKLKNGILIDELMAITIVSGSFFCMVVYFLARFITKNPIILFFAGILTLTRAYLSFFNDGNLPENIAFYYAALFIVFLMYALESKRILFTVIAGLCFFLCAQAHAMIFLYNIPAFGLFFITFLLTTNKNFKKDYANLLLTMVIVLILIVPYLLKLKEATPPNTMYGNDATTIINTLSYWNGNLVLIFVLIGSILIAIKRDAINVYLWTYLLIMLFFVEHWRIYQILSPSWFELRTKAVPTFGAYYSYESFSPYPMNYLCSWQAGVIIWPILMAKVSDSLYNFCQRYIKVQVIKKIAVFLLVVLVFLFIGYEFKNARRYPEWILKSDYAALKWVRENTLYENTLIFSPVDNANENAIPAYITAFWVPVVSERKSFPFRNYDLSGQFKFLNIDKSITEKVNLIQKAAYSVTDLESYKVFKDMKVSHIFLSGVLTQKLYNIYQSSPFVELVHYETVPNQSTTLIYKVK